MVDLNSVEKNLSTKILSALQDKDYIHVPFKTFIRLFEAKDDYEFTNKLSSFAYNNNLDYVIVIDSIKGPTFVRFWTINHNHKLLVISSGVCNKDMED